MENTTEPQHKPKKDNTIMFYILGGVIVTAVIIAGFLLYKPSAPATSGTQPVLGEQATAQPTAVPENKPISTLACSQQFYNTVNGVAETYYLSTEGEAPSASTAVTCTVTATINNQVIASEIVTPTLNANTTRGGSTFKCSTQGLKLKANVPVKVTTDIKDNNNTSVSCSRTFLLP